MVPPPDRVASPTRRSLGLGARDEHRPDDTVAGVTSSESASDIPRYRIASVDNALRLLLMLRDEGEIRLSTAAEVLGVANSTAHRLLAMLAHHGFVRQDLVTRGYVAGPALYDVGLAVVRRMDVRQTLRPLLEEVAEQTRETVHLGVLEGTEVRYVDAIESPRALRVAGRTGMVLPAHCSSVGKALLARLDPGEVATRYPAEELDQVTERSLSTRAALERELSRVRRAGFAVNTEESEAGVLAVAVVVEDGSGRPLGAIGCAVPASRMTRKALAELGATLRDRVASWSACE